MYTYTYVHKGIESITPSESLRYGIIATREGHGTRTKDL